MANGQNIDYSEKGNGPRASSAPALGLNTIIFKHVYWYMQQISGERLQDHWSSGLQFLRFLIFFQGIEQMNDLEDMFSDLRSPTTTMPQSSSTWGDELSSLSSPPAPTQPTFSVGGAPFSTPGSMTAVGSAGMFGAAAGPPAGGLAHQQWGAPQTGMAIGGAFPSATPNPFGVSSKCNSNPSRNLSLYMT